jgi:hypothetical protein
MAMATDYVCLDNLHLKTTQVNDDIKIVEARSENQSGQIEQLTKQVDNLELHVKVNQEAYSKASQALPTGTPPSAEKADFLHGLTYPRLEPFGPTICWRFCRTCHNSSFHDWQPQKHHK